MTERFEAVVVGAGPAGSAAALELARNGVQTLILERAPVAGAKNATGGILYGQTNTPHNLDDLVPEFHKEAPVERPIGRYHMHCLHRDRVKSFDITPLHLHEHKWSYAVLRGPFDQWLAARAHEACKATGGGLLTGVRVRGPILEGGRVVGVETDELDPIRADLVIAADGATSEVVRKAGLRGWGGAEKWFQGVKVVVKLPDAGAVEERFGLSPGDGSAHLFAGDLWSGVRGGGFLYTNKDTLSIGTVFHLDSLARAKVEPHALLDRLLQHPMLQPWLADAAELEYSAKLIPDGKKMMIERPWKPGLLAIGDAAGQLQAQGPVIKGMNLGISAGILAAKSYVAAKRGGDAIQAGPRYERALRDSYVPSAVRPMRYRIVRALAENPLANALMEAVVRNPLARWAFRREWGQRLASGLMSNPWLAGANPDVRFGYVTLPSQVARAAGDRVANDPTYKCRALDERIAALTYDTDIGRAHIRLKDPSPEASGRAVHTCPVSSATSSRGCYRLEHGKNPDGTEERVVVLDTQPCVECGTCAIMAATEWDHPRGGKGVLYRYG